MKLCFCKYCPTIVEVLNNDIDVPKCPMCERQARMNKALLEELKMSNRRICIKTIRLLHRRLSKWEKLYAHHVKNWQAVDIIKNIIVILER